MKKYLRILLMCLLMLPLSIVDAGVLPSIEQPVYYTTIESMDIIMLLETPKEISSVSEQIIFTNYYVKDSTNSKNITSAGLTTNDFRVNENGWYTYEDRVVVAAATYLCLKVQSGGCGRYNTIPKGLKLYNLREEILIEVDGKQYNAIILDSCGACMVFNPSDEGLQRFDIFVAGKQYAFGKIIANLITTK